MKGTTLSIIANQKKKKINIQLLSSNDQLLLKAVYSEIDDNIVFRPAWR